MKADFTSDYRRPTPTRLFKHLKALSYVPPAVLAWMVEVAARDVRSLVLNPGFLDLGCSYGTNSMTLCCGLSLRDIYAAAESGQFELEQPAGLFDKSPDSYMVGLDISEDALLFARRARLVDQVILGDLEQRPLRGDEAALLAGVRVMISTGVIGYASHKTFQGLLGSGGLELSFGLATCAEWYPIDKIVMTLAERGYFATPLYDLVFPQRRVADAAEREWIAGTRSRSCRATSDNGDWLTCYPVLFGDRRSAVEDLAAALRKGYASFESATYAEVAADLLDFRVRNRIKT